MNYYDEEISLENLSSRDSISLQKLPKESTSGLQSLDAAVKTITPLAGDLRKAHQSNSLEGSDLSESESDTSKSEKFRPIENKLPSPEQWKNLDIPQDVKDIFQYILKYTPQYIETEYHLQPFVPEYVPAVGDVDAFLKVTYPELTEAQTKQGLTDHLKQMGLAFLDEPSGQQSEPSVLSMKLRSFLTGSGKGKTQIDVPIAKNLKDIDKWITEVEQVRMGQSIVDSQPSKDLHTLLADWPQSFEQTIAKIGHTPDDNNASLEDYAKMICEIFGIEIEDNTQAAYITGINTLFSLYLLVNSNSFD